MQIIVENRFEKHTLFTICIGNLDALFLAPQSRSQSCLQEYDFENPGLAICSRDDCTT